MKKFITMALLFTGTAVLTACLKDKKGNIDPDGSPAVVEWSTTQVGTTPETVGPTTFYALSYPLLTAAKMDFYVNYTGGAANAQDVTVNLGISQAALTAFDPAYKTAHSITSTGNYFTLLPTNLYTMPTSVTIPAGQRMAKVSFTVNTAGFDFSKIYALPITITSVSTGTPISGNYGTVIVQVSPQNEYDGEYSAKGIVVRQTDPALSGFFKGQTYQLKTTGPNSVTFSQLWANGGGIAGIDGTTITVNPTTKAVTMSATGNPVLTNNNQGITDPLGSPGTGFNNRYDPATKTFYLSFYWGTGPTNRAAQDTLVYKGPRH